MKGSRGNIVMKSSIGNFWPWRIHLKNPTTRTRRVGITFQTKKCNILAYYHKLLTKQLNFFVVLKRKAKTTFFFKNIAANYLQRCVGRANE